MIYETVSSEAPIRQGDIFLSLPRVDFSLQNLDVVTEGEEIVPSTWNELIARDKKDLAAVCAIRPVAAIVATQDCDALRSTDITLCEIRPIAQVDAFFKNCNSAKSWMSALTQQTRKNLKWFYLPADVGAGFTEKMAADFLMTLRVQLNDLLANRSLRRVRLNAEADEHFRERLSEFFRRYPYDEWYPLNREEFEKYRDNYSDAEPREYQKPAPAE